MASRAAAAPQVAAERRISFRAIEVVNERTLVMENKLKNLGRGTSVRTTLADALVGEQ
jgi:hypothetical protein